ncbi:MAG: hypothetical protein EXS14_06715 [Planctomycetes bacterium]|nr:hypothetical protein [Planctomycetota bacterium]
MNGQRVLIHRTSPQLRTQLLWLLVPVLLLAQVFGVRATLFHAHGEIGEHVHMLAASHDEATLHDAAAWHHSQHESDEHQQLTSNEPVDDHEGVLLALPPVLVATACAKIASAAITAHLQAIHATLLCSANWLHPQPVPLVIRAEIPQARRPDSAAAMLLGSSQALLI